MNKIALVYTTAPMDLASEIANAAVEAGLAVCANIFPAVQSIYMWQGVVEQADESVIVCKTSVEKAAMLKNFIATHHPYQVPAILQLEASANDAFFEHLANCK